MLAAVAVAQNADDPLGGLELREVPDPVVPDGWAKVAVRSSALNMHDVWTLRGVGHPADRIPMILGCDAAGVDENGNEVIVYPVIADADGGMGDETLDPNRALLSEQHDGAFAGYLVVPRRNLIPKPDWLSFDEAACLPVAWTTAYRMLFTQAQLKAGDRVLVQGAGVASPRPRSAWPRLPVPRCTPRAAVPTSVPPHSNWGHTLLSRPAPACRRRSTSSSRRSARPRGRTPCVRCDRAARS